MDPKYYKFLEAFADAIHHANATELSQMMVPWTKPTSDPLEMIKMMNEKITEVVQELDLDETLVPANYEIDYNDCDLEELKEDFDAEEIPNEINDDNFRQWTCIQFIDQNEEYACFDFWSILVEIDDEYKIGFFEIEYPD